MGGKEITPSSSIDSSRSSCDPAPCTARRGLSTELRLGNGSVCYSRERDQTSKASIEQLAWSKLTENEEQRFFVKVHMEGISIGRKLDLHAHSGYDSLRDIILGRMFSTSIMCKAPPCFPDGGGPKIDQMPSDHVLTYQDWDGDWMMVGDVPWKVFLSSVKRLKITKADNC